MPPRPAQSPRLPTMSPRETPLEAPLHSWPLGEEIIVPGVWGVRFWWVC
jgi:hypothetical protein